MNNKKIVAARRQPPNLKKQLFQPRFETTPPTNLGSVTACKNVPGRKPTRGQPCRCCDALNECTSFRFHGTDDNFQLRWHFTCDTMNVIYALTCAGCGKNYIGQTERAVRDRCGDYRRAISEPRFHTQGVHRHIAQCGQGNFTMTPFFKLKNDNHGHDYILSYESHFIKRYKPSLNESKLWFNKKDIQIPYIFAISPQMALQQMKLDSNRIQQTMWLMINLRSFSFFPALVSLQIMSKKMLFSMELSNCVLSVI